MVSAPGFRAAFQRSLLATGWLTSLAACGDESVCPPTEPPGRPVDPDWCEPIYQTGGWRPIIAVIAVAVVVVAMAFMLALRIRDRGRRFWVLFAVVYIMAGLVSTTIINAYIFVSVGDMVSDPLPYLLQVLVWPLFLATYLGGSYGR